MSRSRSISRQTRPSRRTRFGNQTRASRWTKSDKINAAILGVLGVWAVMDRADIKL